MEEGTEGGGISGRVGVLCGTWDVDGSVLVEDPCATEVARNIAEAAGATSIPSSVLSIRVGAEVSAPCWDEPAELDGVENVIF